MSSNAAEIEKTVTAIRELSEKLEGLRKEAPPTPVKNHKLRDLAGEVSLLELFGDKETLMVIHNMGQACRYCTLWADGINGFLPHLENLFSVVLVSKDEPGLQRQFAGSRGWRYRMASHAGSDYMKENSVGENGNNAPGMVCFVRKGNEIFKKNFAQFGPGDLFCSIFHIVNMAGLTGEEWTPQFNYWQRPAPAKMEDGGQNLI
jgi:predicted dithiol-disulfide oxidoreductase (DUF899 family)